MGDFRSHTAGKTNDSLVVFFEVIVVGTGFVIFAVDFGVRHDAAKVLEAFVVHGEKCDMEALLIFGWVAVGHFARSNIGLEAEDWLESSILAGLIQFDKARHGAVVCYGDGFHAVFFYEINKLWDLGQAIKKRVMSVIVQVHKITWF